MIGWPLVGLGPYPFDRHRRIDAGSSEHDVAVPADRDPERVAAGFTAD